MKENLIIFECLKNLDYILLRLSFFFKDNNIFIFFKLNTYFSNLS